MSKTEIEKEDNFVIVDVPHVHVSLKVKQY
jgi:hypothetical protein